MVVIVPSDSIEAEKATLALAKDNRPGYLRLARDASPVITTKDTPFEIGKAYTFTEGKDLTIISTGTMTYHAMAAAEKLYKSGIDAEVLHVPTIKPLDGVSIIKSVNKTNHVITVEEHQAAGGLGSAVAELLSEEHPVKIKRMGVRNQFGESGKPGELLEKHQLTAKHVMLEAHRMLG